MAKFLRTVRRFPTNKRFVFAAADFITGRAARSVSERGRFLLVLAGGNTPRLLYEYLAKKERVEAFPWAKTHVFWADERLTPRGGPAANAGMAERLLLSKVPIPEGNIHRPPVDAPSPEAAAKLWEEELAGFFGGFPVFDLVLLGVGSDGHTASLFPGHPALGETKRWALPVSYPLANPPVDRVTLTLPVINRARCVLFLCGREKEGIVREIEKDRGTVESPFPAARVLPAGELYFFVSGEEMTQPGGF
ncbi:6-phosphogluconolactonase [bacterium]|nr:MAG: 6-phosphogluconolactonase [bacterium]